MIRRVLVLGLVSAAAVALLGPAAFAKRPPTLSERTAIRSAIDAFIAKPGSPAASDNRTVSIRVATPGAHYARVNLNSPSAGPSVVLLRLRSGAWRVIAFGSADFACRLAPAAVWKDLFPRGFCIPAG